MRVPGRVPDYRTTIYGIIFDDSIPCSFQFSLSAKAQRMARGIRKPCQRGIPCAQFHGQDLNRANHQVGRHDGTDSSPWGEIA
jgi:hypothetical protein